MPILSFDQFIAYDFDYFVVGGGTSGLVVAARLAQNTTCVVGVIEAGEYHEKDPEVTVPGMMARAIHNPKFDWTFFTVPQKHANDREILQSRGKGLGGSSMLNFLASVRPAKEELDAFETLGNVGWTWESMLKYMKKSEHLMPPPLSQQEARVFAASPDPSLHGSDGPIAKSFPPHIPKIHVPLIETLEASGVSRNPDNSNGRPVGAVLFPTSVDSATATRSYSASAYYVPNSHRSNLLVLTGATAIRVHLENASGGLKRAVALDVVSGDNSATVKANKEIIISAGTFQTPQLLELSGVGDKRILSSLNIDCIINLPGVGENLQDHALTPTIAEVDKSVESLEILHDPVQLQKHQDLYKQQKGILAGIPSSCFAFIPGNVLANDAELDNWLSSASLEATPGVFKETHPDVKRGFQKQYEILRTWVKDPIHPMGQLLNLNGHFPVPGLTVDHSKRYMTLLCAYTHPFHRGTVHITTTDPFAHPAIEQNYLSNPTDLNVLVKVLQFVDRLYETKPLADWVKAKVVPSLGANPDVEAIRKYVKETLLTVHHPVGTAAMLPREDGGVVDNKLLVYGTSNLRVVDCSIIPLQISANIQTLAYAIGEKAADMIIEAL